MGRACNTSIYISVLVLGLMVAMWIAKHNLAG